MDSDAPPGSPPGRPGGGDGDAPIVAVFDTESDSLFSELPADKENAFALMRFTVAAVYLVGIETEPRIYVPGMEDRLIEALEAADALVAYNADFDLLLLKKHFAGRGGHAAWERVAAKTFDPFDEIRTATGRWPKLDAVCRANGLGAKNDLGVDGKDAVRLWRDGQADRAKLDLLHRYCAEDVKVTAKLLDLEGDVRVPPPTEGTLAYEREDEPRRAATLSVADFREELAGRAAGRTARRPPTFAWRGDEPWSHWDPPKWSRKRGRGGGEVGLK